MLKSAQIFFLILISVLLLINCPENITERFSTVPLKAVPGSEIVVKYNPEGTKLANADKINMIVYHFSTNLEKTESLEMSRSGNGWKAKFRADQASFGAMIKL